MEFTKKNINSVKTQDSMPVWSNCELLCS